MKLPILLLAMAAMPLFAQTADIGKWNYSDETSKIDDTKIHYFRLDAESDVRSGYKTDRPSLMVRWKEGKLKCYIATDLFLGSDEMPVTTRFDKKPAKTETWNISSDHEAAFSRKAIFIMDILAARSLVVRLTPYGQSPIEIEFDVHGLLAAMEPIRAKLPSMITQTDGATQLARDTAKFLADNPGLEEELQNGTPTERNVAPTKPRPATPPPAKVAEDIKRRYGSGK